MKQVSLSLILLALALCQGPALSAQESGQDTLSTKAKIDSIYHLQKRIYREIKNEPLADKSWGMEFNFFRTLIIDEDVTLSGGFSFFNLDRNAELAFPVYYARPGDAHNLREWTIDCHYRYFLGNTQNGFYLSGFTRFAHLAGYEGENEVSFSDSPAATSSRTTQNKVGIGVGLGYRKFSYKGLYWGCSFNFGRYLGGRNEVFYSDWDNIASFNNDDSKYIIDFELLKFGWAF
jgi:hypothetical protein